MFVCFFSDSHTINTTQSTYVIIEHSQTGSKADTTVLYKEADLLTDERMDWQTNEWNCLMNKLENCYDQVFKKAS